MVLVISRKERGALSARHFDPDSQPLPRYCNMDYIIFSAFMALSLLRVVVTYDITCQWSANLRSQAEKLPAALKLSPSTKIETAIPSWHINGHGKKCQETKHVGYLDGIGRLCGDEVEQTWWSTNILRTSIREMMPAAQHEMMSHQWAAFNIIKISGFRTLNVLMVPSPL